MELIRLQKLLYTQKLLSILILKSLLVSGDSFSIRFLLKPYQFLISLEWIGYKMHHLLNKRKTLNFALFIIICLV